MANSTSPRSIITDKLVVEKTGKSLEDWYGQLDRKGAQKLDQEEIYRLVNSISGLKPLGEWNQNLLATSYSWSRGLKERGEKKDGFEVSVSKTVNTELPLLYKSFIEERTRNKWLGKENITIRKATENKSARMTWTDGQTSLSVDFYEKGKNKSQVVVQHMKIKTKPESEKMKLLWQEKLEVLKLHLEA